VKRAAAVSKRLREWGIREFGSLVNLARAIGISQQSLYDYTSGRTLPGNKMQSRLRGLGCEIEWLMTGCSTGVLSRKRKWTGLSAASWATYEGRLVATPEGEEQWEQRKDPDGAGVPYRKGSFFCLEIASDVLSSAEPLPICPGDICIFESGRRPKNGDVVAVGLKEDLLLVRVVKHVSRTEVELCPANQYRQYPSITVKKSDIARMGVLKSVMQLTGGEKRLFGIQN
jgi:hypothetical protein